MLDARSRGSRLDARFFSILLDARRSTLDAPYMVRASLVLDPIVGSPALFGHTAPRISAGLGLDARFFGLGLDARC